MENAPFLITIIVFLFAAFLALYGTIVAAGNADKRMEEMFEEYKKEREKNGFSQVPESDTLHSRVSGSGKQYRISDAGIDR